MLTGSSLLNDRCLFYIISEIEETGCFLPVEIKIQSWEEMDSEMSEIAREIGNRLTRPPDYFKQSALQYLSKGIIPEVL